jgi:tetratricopeptide (TPR) repeat protein
VKTPWVFALAIVALLLTGWPAVAAPAAASSILEDEAFRTEALAGLDRLYRMDFAGADRIFAQIDKSYPGHPAGPFLKALVPWWNILLDPENPGHDAELMAAMDQVVARSEHRLRRNPKDLDGLFFKTGAFAFRARVHTYRDRWLKAAQDGRRALSNLRELHRRQPQNDDLYFGLGLFDYLVDAVPREHRFLGVFARMFARGDRQRGLAELERAATRGRFVQAEARFALYQVHYIFEKNPQKALENLAWLRQRYPTNALFQLEEGKVYANQGRWAESAVLLQEVAELQVEGRSGYSGALAEKALYWLARGEMASRRYDSALEYLDRLDHLAAERNYNEYFQAAGRLRRGMSYDALGRRKEALRCYREVLGMGKGAGDDVRDRARELLEKPFPG